MFSLFQLHACECDNHKQDTALSMSNEYLGLVLKEVVENFP